MALLAELQRCLAQWCGSPEQVFLAGHSAGGHLAALAACPATARWVCAQGKKTGLVISHIVRLPTPLPYRGIQGIHYLPADVPPAATLFDSPDVQELLTPAEVAMFTALHASHDWSRKRKRRPST